MFKPYPLRDEMIAGAISGPPPNFVVRSIVLGVIHWMLCLHIFTSSHITPLAHAHGLYASDRLQRP